jgi:RimJ/RimL family protein N-acetyltransferase/16S rRNA G966 N2-methylase RsmD
VIQLPGQPVVIKDDKLCPQFDQPVNVVYAEVIWPESRKYTHLIHTAEQPKQWAQDTEAPDFSKPPEFSDAQKPEQMPAPHSKEVAGALKELTETIMANDEQINGMFGESSADEEEERTYRADYEEWFKQTLKKDIDTSEILKMSATFEQKQQNVLFYLREQEDREDREDQEDQGDQGDPGDQESFYPFYNQRKAQTEEGYDKDHALQLLYIHDMTPKQTGQLFAITQDKEIMKNIGKGNTWSAEYIEGLKQQSQKDMKIAPFERKYYTFVMLVDGNVIGLISLHPGEKGLKGLQIRRLISKDSQGKGFGTEALEILMQTYSSLIAPNRMTLWSLTDAENQAAIKSVEKLGWVTGEPIVIQGKRKVSHYWIVNQPPYPLYNQYYKLRKDRFFELVNAYKPTIIDKIPPKMKHREEIEKYTGSVRAEGYCLIQENWQQTQELNNVTDWFTERVRIKCQFRDKLTPLQYWNQNDQAIFQTYMERSGKQTIDDETDIQTLRDIMYELSKFCNNFRISVALAILGIFKAKKWLDISAGWGDRLLAAIGYGVEKYVAVDPNTELHPAYQYMIEQFVDPEKQKNFIVLDDGFEHAKIPEDNYDLVFSSPPFFDLEKYSSGKKDSITAYPEVAQWYEQFLLVSINKAHDHLTSGGHMVLYMADAPKTDYVGKMCKYLDQLMINEGSIYYFEDSKLVPRRFYVWRKK